MHERVKYHENNTHDCLVDPTLDLKWKSLKAKNIGLSLDVTNTNLGDNHLIPSELKTEICALKCLDGWGKVLDGIPLSFSSEHIMIYLFIILNVVANFLKRCIWMCHQYI